MYAYRSTYSQFLEAFGPLNWRDFQDYKLCILNGQVKRVKLWGRAVDVLCIKNEILACKGVEILEYNLDIISIIDFISKQE